MKERRQLFLVFDNLVVNPAWWDGLPKDVRDGIQRATDKAVQASLITRDGVDQKEIDKLNQNGMQAVVLTASQQKAFEDAMQPAVRDEFLKSSGRDGQKLIDLVKAL